jgi:hypothetical protein
MKTSLNEVRKLIAEALRKAYDILGVTPLASQEEIKKAYKQAVAELHPDLNPGVDTTEDMMQLNVAYGLLSDPSKRAAYDATGSRTLGDDGSAIGSGPAAAPKPSPKAAPKAEPAPQNASANEQTNSEATILLSARLIYRVPGSSEERKIWITTKNGVVKTNSQRGTSQVITASFTSINAAIAAASRLIDLWKEDGFRPVRNEPLTPEESDYGGKQADPRAARAAKEAPPKAEAPKAEPAAAPPPPSDGKKTFVNADADVVKVWIDGTTLCTEKNGVLKKASFDTVEDAEEHEVLVTAGLKSHGYKQNAGDASAPKAKAPSATGVGRGGANKELYKIYGKFAGDERVAPVHTRYKAKVYGGAPDTKFKPNTAAKIKQEDPDTLTVIDPETGHTQKWGVIPHK